MDEDTYAQKRQALIQALQLARYRQQAGQQMAQGMPLPSPNASTPSSGNPYAPPQVIRQPPWFGLSSMLDRGIGAWTQQQALGDQQGLQAQLNALPAQSADDSGWQYQGQVGH